MSNLPSDVKKIGGVAADDVKKIIALAPLSVKNGGWRFPSGPTTISNEWSIDIWSNGTKETLTLDHHADFDFDWDSEFSVSGWVKTADSGWRGWVKKEVTSTTGGAFTGWSVGQYNGQVMAFLVSHWNQGGKFVAGYTNGFTINDDNYHHVVITFDGSGTLAGTTCYVDGAAQALSAWASGTSTATNSTTNSEPLVIGHMPVNGYTAAYWDGPLDEISIWDRELSSGDVDDIYNGGTPNNLKGHSAAEDLLGWWRFGDGPGDSSDSTDSDARIYDQSGNGHNLTGVNTDAGDVQGDTP